MHITITRRTARNVCYTIVSDREPKGRKDCMLHDKFASWIAKCPSAVVVDLAA